MEEPPQETIDPVYKMLQLTAPKPVTLSVFTSINKVELPMETDTGTSISIISKKTYSSM